MSEVILKIENLSKQYRLGLIGTGTLSHDLKRWWYQIRGKEDPFLKIGETNDRSKKGTSEYVWALKDINIEVQKGEVLGIIGKNGAGKSTLLKILSKVTGPTTGSIKSKGRIASLLEVGTGFHPELTGKENIYLNGAILGMTKAEINAKYQEIVDFSGCERYIDTPVKRYSSGMRVRLAFAVAAFLEPDILVVDEVLAVGDAEFQKKAIGKMQDISKGEGRTVLFVSHNMAAVKNLCTRGVVLENGSVAFSGNTDKSIEFYLRSNKKNGINKSVKKNGLRNIIVNDIKLSGCQSNIVTGMPFEIEFYLKNISNQEYKNIRIDFKIDSVLGQRILWYSSVLDSKANNKLFKKEGKIIFSFEKLPIINGDYVLSYVLTADGQIQENVQDYYFFEISPGMYYDSTENITQNHTSILVDCKVRTKY